MPRPSRSARTARPRLRRPAFGQCLRSTATAFGGGSDLRSLFQTDRRATANDAVAKLWQGRTSGTATARPAPSYFPRSDEAESRIAAPLLASADPEDIPAVTGSLGARSSRPVRPSSHAPLPPRRPAEFGAAPSANTLFAPRRGP